MKKIALIPGSFDPLTNGHLDMIERSAKLFDEVIVASLINTSKKSLFTPVEKKQLIEEAIGHLENVKVLNQEGGLTIHLARRLKANVLVRGLRNTTDFEYEAQIDHLNKIQSPEIETVYLLAKPEYQMLSSSMIKEIAMFGGTISGLVPEHVERLLVEKLNLNQEK